MPLPFFTRACEDIHVCRCFSVHRICVFSRFSCHPMKMVCDTWSHDASMAHVHVLIIGYNRNLPGLYVKNSSKLIYTSKKKIWTNLYWIQLLHTLYFRCMTMETVNYTTPKTLILLTKTLYNELFIQPIYFSELCRKDQRRCDCPRLLFM